MLRPFERKIAAPWTGVCWRCVEQRQQSKACCSFDSYSSSMGQLSPFEIMLFQKVDSVGNRDDNGNARIVCEPRWDGQVESWNYLVQFGAQLRAVPEESLETVTVVQSPWESLEQGSLSGNNCSL